MLNWFSGPNYWEAVGLRGWYTVTPTPAGCLGYVLTAVGHDELPMLAIPASGKWFGKSWDAKHYASRLDRVRVLEPMCGGE